MYVVPLAARHQSLSRCDRLETVGDLLARQHERSAEWTKYGRDSQGNSVAAVLG